MPINWPDKYHPDRTGVHVRNSLTVTATPEVLWPWMIRAQLWPTWYPNSSDVVFRNTTGSDLQQGTKFRWKTFGVSIESEVQEFIPYERLAWNAIGTGVDAYHAWLFEPTPTGCTIFTEETQNGFLAKLVSLIMPNRMHKYHQICLENLRSIALKGSPPSVLR